MPDRSIRAAYPTWPDLNARLRETVAALTDEQLLLTPTPERWPLWATIGHLACQRVFWLCDFAGEPGADTTRFTNAGWDCPGDDDLENILSSADLVEALDSTFRIVDGVLDRWTFDSLTELIDRTEGSPGRSHARGWILQRVYGHDMWHVAEVNETLGRSGLPQIDPWN